MRELSDLGIDSIHVREGVGRDELLAIAEFLWQIKDTHTEPVDEQLARRNIRTSAWARSCRSTPGGARGNGPTRRPATLDPAYAESLVLAQETFDNTAAGKKLDLVTVRDLVQLLIHRSRAATPRSGRFSPSSCTRT